MERNENGTFKQGSTPNPAGRPKGSLNNSTKELREFFKNFVESNLSKIQQDYEELEAKDRLKFLLDLSKFVLPIQKAVDVTSAGQGFTNAPPVINVQIIPPELEE